MDPAEVEFLAEKELVTIVPNFKGNKQYLLSVSINCYHNQLSKLQFLPDLEL